MTTSQFASETGGYPERSRATAVLVLAVAGLVGQGVVSPVAWWLGNRELAAIDAGRRSPVNRSLAKAGRIIGIVGTAILTVVVTAFLLALIGVIRVD
jgi:hypothetical protein